MISVKSLQNLPCSELLWEFLALETIEIDIVPTFLPPFLLANTNLSIGLEIFLTPKLALFEWENSLR